MANHKSVKKRIRQTIKLNLSNRYYAKTTRNSIRKFYSLTNEEEIKEMFPKTVSLVDRLLKRNIIHKNKAANIKSKINKHLNSFSTQSI